MFDIAPTELMLVALIALVVIGPKDLPRVMRVVGQWLARARGVAQHFRTGVKDIVRQAEIEEIERKWADENARIMRAHPPANADATADMSHPAPPPATAPHPSGQGEPATESASPRQPDLALHPAGKPGA